MRLRIDIALRTHDTDLFLEVNSISVISVRCDYKGDDDKVAKINLQSGRRLAESASLRLSSEI